MFVSRSQPLRVFTSFGCCADLDARRLCSHSSAGGKFVQVKPDFVTLVISEDDV